MVRLEALTSFFHTHGPGRLFFSLWMSRPRRYPAPFGAIPNSSGMTSANSCQDFSISRTGNDPLNDGNGVSMNDPGNGVFSTIPPIN